MGTLPRSFLRLAAALAPAVALAQADGGPGRPLHLRTTPHYELRLQGTDEDGARYETILELCWPKFREFFQAEPKLDAGQRLSIQLYDDARQCLDGAMGDKADMPPIKHPAWFSPGNGRVYLYRHESDWYTRYLLVYAACLQFHGLAKPKNIDLDAWYTHGIAESLAMHAFDGERLELATSPPICWMDHPARALKELGGKHLGLDPFDDARLEDPSVRWAVARFASTGAGGRYRPRFEKLALGFSGSKVSGHDFARSLGAEKRIAEEFSAWLLGNQLPLEVVTPDWESLPDGRILGKPGGERISLCAAKERFDTIEAVVGTSATDKTAGVPGFVLSLQGEDDYVCARIVAPLIFVEHVRAGKKYGIETLSLGLPGPYVRIRARTVGERCELEVEGKAYPPIEVPPGRVGLAAIGGSVVFDTVRWR